MVRLLHLDPMPCTDLMAFLPSRHFTPQSPLDFYFIHFEQCQNSPTNSNSNSSIIYKMILKKNNSEKKITRKKNKTLNLFI